MHRLGVGDGNGTGSGAEGSITTREHSPKETGFEPITPESQHYFAVSQIAVKPTGKVCMSHSLL